MAEELNNDSSESDTFEVIDTNGPVQIIRDNGDHTFTLCENDLATILMAKNLKDTPVVVVSVAGAFRKGKSFLLDFILRYLTCEGRSGWMGDPEEDLTGFKWRGGTNRETSGIWIWGQPFIRTNPSTGEKVAILLMDTQGTFDNQAIVRDSATIFALSTMLSSIQIFNISQQISEDDLQHLHLFTDYGRLAMQDDSDDSKCKPFQRLEFLIRDWAFEYEFELGASGGKNYLNKILAVSENQHEELMEVRHHITNCFADVGCFLLPYPGRTVASKPQFTGRLADMEGDFASGIEKLIPYYLHEETLQSKKIHGQTLKGKDLLHYFKSYVEIYQQDTLPEPMTMLRATAEANNLSALASAQEKYTENMEKKVGGDHGYLNDTDMLTQHAESIDLAEKEFNSTRKMGGAELSKTFLEKLEKYMEDQFQQYTKINESKNIFKSARTPITLFIVLAVAYVAHGILKAVYLGPLAMVCNAVFWGAMSTLGVWITLKWRAEHQEVAERIDHVAEMIWEQGLTPFYGLVVAAGTTAAIKHAQAAQQRSKSKKS
ncbi:atlastin-1-like isoform X1 [Bolinopsis microptera]|uniref:atlastin-1-like isoform X1 n=1 Tax=Bolinopsis microptera TaxID=2820187 RepID=UPI003078E4ED